MRSFVTTTAYTTTTVRTNRVNGICVACISGYDKE